MIRLSDHSLEDIERRYLNCVGRVTLSDGVTTREVIINEVYSDSEELKLTLYPERIQTVIPVTCDWLFEYNIPKTQWFYSPTGDILFIRRSIQHQFKRGINSNTLYFSKLSDFANSPQLLSYNTNLGLSALTDTPLNRSNLKSKLKLQKSCLLSSNFALHKGNILHHTTIVGTVDCVPVMPVFTVSPLFVEEFTATINRLNIVDSVIRTMQESNES